MKNRSRRNAFLFTVLLFSTSAYSQRLKDFDEYDAKSAKKGLKAAALEPLKTVRLAFEELTDWNRKAIHEAMSATVTVLDIGFGKLGMPLRVAVTGGNPSPDLDLTIELVGKDATLRRIDRAIAYIEALQG